MNEVDDPETWVKTEQSRFDCLNSNGMPLVPPTLMFFKGEQPRKSDRVLEFVPKKQKKNIFLSIEEREA